MKTDFKRPPRPDKKNKCEVMFHGMPASPGIAMGKVMLLAKRGKRLDEPDKRAAIEPDAVQGEIARFKESLDKTRLEITELMNRVRARTGESDASIFEAHFLIVDDKMLMKEVCSRISENLLSAESSFKKTIQKYIEAISAVQDAYLQERAGDIRDVAERILNNLSGQTPPTLDKLPGPRIIVAKELAPSDTAMLDRENVLAFAIESGSKTSHTAILARSMKIPAIVGMSRLIDRLEDGDNIIIDGFLGTAVLNPEKVTVSLYEQKERGKAKLYNELMRETQLQSETTDGRRVKLAMNIDNPANLGDVRKYGAAGIGLFRTEYLFMNRCELPSEEEQFEVYKKVAQACEGQTVIIRTLDIGGDKLSTLFESFHEQNPFLGLRAVRLCLAKPEIIKTQMRAILRAGLFGDIKMMFPMVSGLDELNQLLAILDSVKSELQNANTRFNGALETGIMIEIPSAAVIADKLAEKVDFFSIGTNDLVQYTLAVDRNNEKVAHLYEPTHPAVLGLIAGAVAGAAKHGIWVGVCGEAASDPKCIPILLGLGVRELSMSPVSIGQARRLIRCAAMSELEELAEKALTAANAREATAYAVKYLERKCPNLLRGEE